ncbi:hypothetical protein Tco_0929218 [Tanacetum coccineum]
MSRPRLGVLDSIDEIVSSPGGNNFSRYQLFHILMQPISYRAHDSSEWTYLIRHPVCDDCCSLEEQGSITSITPYISLLFLLLMPPPQDSSPRISRFSYWIRRRSAILIRPEEAIPFGRPYRTHLNGPRKLLTARKRVGPIPAHRLASKRVSPRSSDHRSSSSSSSSDSSPVHSSGLDAFRRWCAAPLSTLYPPTTSDSSSGDSSERPLHSSSRSAGPSCKRCRSPVDSVPSSTLIMRSLAPTRADLLPPRKRFKDSYSFEASIEEDTEIDPIETKVDMELGIGDGDDVRDHVEIDHRDVRDDTEEYEADTSAGDTVKVGIDPMSAPIVEEEIVEPAGEDSSDSSALGMALLGHSRIFQLTWMMLCVTFTITCLRFVLIGLSGLRLLMRQPMPPMLSRLKTKAKIAVMATMEMVEMEMVEMEMVEMEMVEMRIQMRMVEVIDLLLENAPTRTL